MRMTVRGSSARVPGGTTWPRRRAAGPAGRIARVGRARETIARWGRIGVVQRGEGQCEMKEHSPEQSVRHMWGRRRARRLSDLEGAGVDGSARQRQRQRQTAGIVASDRGEGWRGGSRRQGRDDCVADAVTICDAPRRPSERGRKGNGAGTYRYPALQAWARRQEEKRSQGKICAQAELLTGEGTRRDVGCDGAGG